MNVDHWFYGPHRHNEVRYKAEEINRQAVKDRCTVITVTADELARAVDHEGVSSFYATKLVTMLLLRAEHEAVAATLGVEP